MWGAIGTCIHCVSNACVAVEVWDTTRKADLFQVQSGNKNQKFVLGLNFYKIRPIIVAGHCC